MSAAPAWEPAALAASPLLATVRPLLARLPVDRFPALEDLNALARAHDVRSGGGAPLVFVPADPAPHGPDARYEVRIFRDGEVPTRAGNWHDLFNALAWLAFPCTKATLNRRHFEAIAWRPDARDRGTARDVLTLFDEGGVIVACADPSLAELLVAFRWKELFWARRAEVAESLRFAVFGHAIHEKALAPYKGVTAKTLIVHVARDELALTPGALLALLDGRAADHFAAAGALASTRSLHPLPILGIPGWTPENADPSFYDDERVFRPGYARAAR